jgi:hypothetical protein
LAGRSQHTAVKAFVAPIAEALHCFTRADVRPSGYKSSDGDLLLLLNSGKPVQLAGCDLTLEVVQWFGIVEASGRFGPYKVQTTGYQYILADNGGQNEVFTFHWHPHTSGLNHPHVHVPAPDRRLHVPTGRIAIEEVLLLAHEMGATPLTNSWQRKVYGALERFKNYRTWP